jgi:sugar lactone lactonase YvrE
VFLVGLLLFAFPASAAPVHPPLPGLDLDGSGKAVAPKEFNKACGVTTDSEGDVYVSSAANSTIDIFGPDHGYLGTISNSNEPCGLAVDSKGDLYVSEAKTLTVVRYTPNVYPFSGAPSYGSPSTVDSSGKAKGIAIDPADDRLYVADGDRISVYESDGTLAGTVGLGQLTNATGVAAYTSPSGDRYVFAADGSLGVIRVFTGTSLASLTLRETIDGSDEDGLKADRTPDNGIGFGAAGAYLAVDQANGHLLVYDDEHRVVDEFEASGVYFTQIDDPGFVDAAPTAIAVFPQRNEVQQLKIEAEAGAYSLELEGEATGPIPYNATDTQVEAALEALSTVGEEDLAVAGGYSGAFASGSYSIAFSGALGSRDVDQLLADGSGLSGGPGATVTTETEGSGPGRVYVTAGAGPGAKVLTFGAPPAPSRPPRPDLSFHLDNACGVAVDSHGNRYVAADASIGVYPPTGNTPLTTINDPGLPCDLAVDSSGHVFALNRGSASAGDEKAVYYTPDAFPPVAGTHYSAPTTLATPADFPAGGAPQLRSIGINPSNDHVFVSQSSRTIEFNSASAGSAALDSNWGSGLGLTREDVAVYGVNGDVYVVDESSIAVVNQAGTQVLARIDGSGSPKGPFGPMSLASIAVDQANGHLLVFLQDRGVAEEYEASGVFLAEFGSSVKGLVRLSGIAVDNSGGVNDGSAYVAFFKDLTAFGSLAYGEPPIAHTGLASGVGSGNATLNGTVNPRGFDLSECKFEYLTDAQFDANGKTFAGATSTSCLESIAAIGKGTSPVAVHANLSGLDPEGRYRFRLLAVNQYGEGEGEAALFGPPLLTTRSAHPVSYAEATLRARIDPSGLTTKYRFEYGVGEQYEQATPTVELQPDAGPVDIAVPVFGLAEGSTYHFRVIAESEAKTIDGPDQTFVTLERRPIETCENAEYRTGRSANLPDCRAYELTTPADTRGAIPYAADHGSTHQFNDWLVAPWGIEAGNRLSFFTNVTLPGYDGNGRFDGYMAERGEGPHPAEGWSSQLISPNYAEAGGSTPAQQGVTSDQLYSFWQVIPREALEGALDPGVYLSTPAGFELVGKGSEGTDSGASSRFVSAAAAHIIFSSKEHLEAGAAPKGTEAIYDRAAGASSASVLSLEPDGSPFGGGEDATYVAATEDGSTVVFKVGGALYAHREGQSTEVSGAPSTFAGISADGLRVFYAASSSGETPATLFACDLQQGPCAGAGAHGPIQIAPDSVFVNVSADGSHVYFTSKDALDGAGEGTPGADNLYVWQDTTGIGFVARLDPEDMVALGDPDIDLLRWTDAVSTQAGPFVGRASSPTRSTPNGAVLVFQSHAQLTAYDNEDHGEIYRYDSEAPAGERLSCVSCDPTNAPANTEASLQSTSGDTPTAVASTVIPNVTDDGQSVFFQSSEQLLPEDANGVQDVYEWRAQGEGCKRPGGCLVLISSGKSENPNYLYGMTPDGHDVFFTTLEKLAGADITGSPSIYDARVEGGIPDPPEAEPCQGDACQGQGSVSPPPAAPVSTAPGNGDLESTKSKPCPRGKRKAHSQGKPHCVKKPHKKHHHKKHRR